MSLWSRPVYKSARVLSGTSKNQALEARESLSKYLFFLRFFLFIQIIINNVIIFLFLFN